MSIKSGTDSSAKLPELIQPSPENPKDDQGIPNLISSIPFSKGKVEKTPLSTSSPQADPKTIDNGFCLVDNAVIVASAKDAPNIVPASDKAASSNKSSTPQDYLCTKSSQINGFTMFIELRKQFIEDTKTLYAESKLAPAELERLTRAKSMGKLAEETAKIAEERLNKQIEVELNRRKTNKEISEQDANKIKKSFDDGIANLDLVVSLLKQERDSQKYGLFSRAFQIALERSLKERIEEIITRSQQDKRNLPAFADTKKPQAALGMSTKSELEEFKLMVDKCEGWLEQSRKPEHQNKLITLLQRDLTPLCPILEKTALKGNLLKELRISIKTEFENDKLSRSEMKALREAQIIGQVEYNKKLNELAEDRLKRLLKSEIDRQTNTGSIKETDRKKVEDLVEKGDVPAELLIELLSHESKENTFGPITRAIYSTSIFTTEQLATEYFIKLSLSGIPRPTKGCLLYPLLVDGIPETEESLQANVISEQRKASLNIIDINQLPSVGELQRFRDAVEWNRQAASLINNRDHKYLIEQLEKNVAKLNMPEWHKKTEDDPLQWIYRVGPLVDMAAQVKAIAQALALADKISVKDMPVNFDKKALSTGFPGKVTLNDDREITHIELALPKDLVPSLENRKAVEKIQKWIEDNKKSAEQCMKALLAAATEKNSVLLWMNQPKNGKHGEKDYNQERHRFTAEEIIVNGKKKIRVSNEVRFYESKAWHFYDLNARHIGTEKCLTIDGELRKDLEKQYQDGTLPADKKAALDEALKQGGKAFSEKLDEMSKSSFRDYDPTDMVAVYKNSGPEGKVELMMASQLKAWGEREALAMKADTGMAITFDVLGMIVPGGLAVRAGFKAMTLAGAAANAVIRTEIRNLMWREFLTGGKSILLGGTGVLLNNSYWQSEAYGRNLLVARDVCFAAEGVYGLSRLTGSGLTNGLRRVGLMKPAAELNETALALEKTAVDIHKWTPSANAGIGGRTLFSTMSTLEQNRKALMLGAESYMIATLSVGISKKVDELLHEKRSAHVEKARDFLVSMRNDEALISRSLKSDATLLAGEDISKATAYDHTAQRISQIAKLPDKEKASKIDELIKEYDGSRDKEEKLLLAAGLLLLVSKDGKLPDTVGNRTGTEVTQEVRGRVITTSTPYLTTRELINELTENAIGKNMATKLVAAQALVYHGKMSMPEYATACRQVLAGDAVAKSTKMQAVIGLSYCLDAAEAQASRKQAPQERLVTAAQAFGCNRAQLEKSLHDTAKRDGDADVRAMAGAMLLAHNGNPEKAETLIMQAQASWKSFQLDGEIQHIEGALKNCDPNNIDLKERLEATLVQCQIERDLVRETLAALREGSKLIPQAQLPASFAEDFEAQLLRDIRSPELADADENKQLALRKLETIQTLELIHLEQTTAKRAEINATLVNLVNMENDLVAIEALKMLLPSRQAELTAEQKNAITQSVHDILNWPHTPPDQATDKELERYRYIVLAKEELLKQLPLLIESLLLNDEQKNLLIKEIILLLRKDDHHHAKYYGDLRAAAIRVLAAIGDKSSNELKKLFEEYSKTANEPNSEVRIAAFHALKQRGDTLALVKENMVNERDPALSAEYAQLEFASLRPNRPECALRIYQHEVQHWDIVLSWASKRYSNEELNEFLRTNYPHTHPKEHETKTALAEGNLVIARKYSEDAERVIGEYAKKYDIGPEHKWPKWIKEVHAKSKELNDQANSDIKYCKDRYITDWDNLVQTAANDTTDKGDKARAALLFLATQNATLGSNRQIDAAKALRKLIINDCPKKGLLYHGFIEAFKHQNTTHLHAARMEFILTLNDLLKDEPAKISKQLAGRIIDEALREEVRQLNRNTDDNAILRQEWLIYLLGKTEYPLTMPLLESLGKDRFSNGDNNIFVHPKIQEKARELFGKLSNTASQNPNDHMVQANLLKETIEQRNRLNNGIKEEEKKRQNDKRSEEQKLFDQCRITGKDGQSTRLAIVQACSGDHIQRYDDPRIPYLQTLLNDPDQGVALTAAWFLVDCINPQYNHDPVSRKNLRNQPFFKEAFTKIQTLANDKTPPLEGNSDYHKWRADAAGYLRCLSSWNAQIESLLAAPPEPSTTLSLKGDLFSKAKSILDGSKPNASTTEKADALRLIIHIGMQAQSLGKADTQKAAAEVLRQVASSQDAELAKIAFDTLQSAVRQHKPLSDEINDKGERVMDWGNDQSTTISFNARFKRITYPNSSWIQLNLDDSNNVVSYSSSDFSGQRHAGQHFHPGSIIITDTCTVVFDEANGIRRIQRPSGDSWSFYHINQDLKESARSLRNTLESKTTSAENKVDAISASLSNESLAGSGIKSVDDPRLEVLNEALSGRKLNGQISQIAGADAIKIAAARALRDRSNTAVPEVYRQQAKSIYLEHGFKNGFITDASVRNTLFRMQEAMNLPGSITNPYDPRIKHFMEALNHENICIRLEAAKILIDRTNTGISNETRKDALKFAANLAADAFQRGHMELHEKTMPLIKEAANAVKEFEFENSFGTIIKLENGNPTKIVNKKCQVTLEWDATGKIKSFTSNDFGNKKLELVSTSDSKNNPSQVWKDADGKLYDISVYANPDGSWGWNMNRDCYYHNRFETGFYTPEGACFNQRYDQYSGRWEFPDGKKLVIHRLNKDGPCFEYDKIQNSTREITRLHGKDSKWKLSEKRFRYDKTPISEHFEADGELDLRTGTIFKQDDQGIRYGLTMNGGTVRYNKADLPISVTAKDGKTILFEYKPNTKILQRLTETDGTAWERTTEDKWKCKRNDSDQWEITDAQLGVDFYGEYFLQASHGKFIIHTTTYLTVPAQRSPR